MPTEKGLISIANTVGAIVARRPALSRVFEQAGIDYCCGGKKTLVQACREKDVDPEGLVGRRSLQRGPEVILDSRLTYRSDEFQARLMLHEIVRGKNKLPDAEDTLQTAETNRYGNRTNVSLVVEEYSLNRQFLLRGLVEGKRIAPNDKGLGYGLIYGLGLGMRMRFSRSYAFDIGLKFSSGSIEDAKVDVSGISMSVAVISTF